MGILDTAKDLLAQNADKVEMAIDKAGEFVDDKTGGKYSDAIHEVAERTKQVTESGASADSAAVGDDQQN